MNKLILSTLGIALSLAATGELKTATLKMADMAAEAQKHQMSYSKFNRVLWSPQLSKNKNGARVDRRHSDQSSTR